MLNYRELSQADYDALVRQFVRLTEGLHSVVQNVGDGKATIGYGYTFNKSDNVSIWQASGIQLNAADWQLLQQIDATSSDAQKTGRLQELSATRSLN
jgi:GH24 family phage-related lysozyme (muramidase)